MLVRKIRVDRLSNYNLRYPKRSYYHKSDYLILYRYEGQTENFDYSPKNTHIVTADNISSRTHFIKTNFFLIHFVSDYYWKSNWIAVVSGQKLLFENIK